MSSHAAGTNLGERFRGIAGVNPNAGERIGFEGFRVGLQVTIAEDTERRRAGDGNDRWRLAVKADEVEGGLALVLS